MISLQDVCQYIDELLQSSSFSDYGVNGLQVEGRSEIRSIATAVSSSKKIIEDAVEAGVDLLIVHHGLFWNRDSYVIEGTKRQKIKLLLENNLSLAAYHLPLDAHRNYGNNWAAAEAMGWRDLEPFGVYNGVPIGVRGKVASQSRYQFQESLENYYNHPAHVALGGNEIVSSAALISGGAHKSILEAATAGVDCFVTGSFDEPIWHQAFEEKINFYALGHANTEEVGPKALALHLQNHFGLPVTFLPQNNPF